MKMHRQLLYLLVLAAGLVACQNDELEAVTSDTTLEFYTSSQIHTRTELQDGTTVLWQDGDQIAVYDFSAPKHTFTASVANGTAQFKGNITARCASFYAAYPNALASENSIGQSILMRLPNEQTAVLGGFAPNTNLSVAKGERNVDGSPSRVTFHNICQLFKFNIPTYAAGRIASIQLSASSGIAGELTVGFNDHNPTISLGNGASNTITLLPPTGTTSFAEGTYHFVVAPVEVKGFTLTLTDTNGKQYTQHSSSTLGGVWNVIYNLGNLDLIDKPVATAQHVYQDGMLVGTTVSLSTPTPDKARSATIKNATGTIVRTLASGMGTLTSDHTDATWPYLPVGTYTVDYTYTTANDKEMSATSTFQITEKPQFSVTTSAASSYTYYTGDEVTRDVAKANSMDRFLVTDIATTVNGIAESLLSHPNYSITISNNFGGNVSSSSAGRAKYGDLSISTLGVNSITTSATFDGVTISDSKNFHITGLPFNHQPPSLDVWSKSGDVTADSSEGKSCLRLGYYNGGSQSITYSALNIPAGTKLELFYDYYAYSGVVGTTFSITTGNQSIKSEETGSYGDKYSNSSAIFTPTTNMTNIVCTNSYGAGATGTDVYRIGLSYSE